MLADAFALPIGGFTATGGAEVTNKHAALFADARWHPNRWSALGARAEAFVPWDTMRPEFKAQVFGQVSF